MSEFPFSEENDDVPARGRALWGLAALAGAAVVVVVIMVFLIGSPGGHHQRHHAAAPGPTQPPARTPSQPSTSTVVSTPTTTVPTTSTAQPSTDTTPSSGGTHASCPSSSPCVLDGDPGGLVAALNAYRLSHGARAVPGAPSAAAQQCALHAGDDAGCPSSYAWEPVSAARGADVVAKIAKRDSGRSWLLDPKARAVAVGWAFVPGTHGHQGHYSVAIVKLS